MTKYSRNLLSALAGLAILLLAAQFINHQPAAANGALSGEYAAGRLFVRFLPGTPEFLKASARAQVDGMLVEEYTLVAGLELLALNSSTLDVSQAAQQLERLLYVDYVEPDLVVQAVRTPNDPSYTSQWGLANIHAEQAWEVTTGEPGFVVAMIDTGIDRSHPDLAANLWQNPGEIPGDGLDNDLNGYVDDVNGWDFAYHDNSPQDGLGHGTHTAGIVGAVGNNGLGVTGVNWNVKLMALKFLDDNGSGYVSNALLALQYAVNKGVKISNNSWGGGGFSQSMYDAIRNAQAVGHLYIAAAGNNGANNDSAPFYPASYNLDNLISVAAITPSDGLLAWSNYGAASVDLGAPGEDIYSTNLNGYAYDSGTSMAAPHVAGVAALLYGLHPDWAYSQVRDAILSSTRPLAALNGKTLTGGALDAAAAVNAATPSTPTPTATLTPTVTPTLTPSPIPTATPTTAIHVGALQSAGSTTSGNRWKATVTITVHNSLHQPLAGVLVTGAWSNGATGSSSCTTGADGKCSVVKSNLSRKLVGVVFNITNLSRPGLTYSSTANDVNLPSITVYRP